MTMEYKGNVQSLKIKPQTIYKIKLKIITKVPIDNPIFLAKTTDKTSIPSIAPPNRIVNPLPIPDIAPPNKAHNKTSLPAIGEDVDTSKNT